MTSSDEEQENASKKMGSSSSLTSSRKTCLLVSRNNPWSKRLFDAVSSADDGVEWIWCTSPDALGTMLNTFKPAWAFFFHWSWIVPEAMHSKHKCVVLHTSNLPYGRGGSPIQNQILEKTISSRVNAIKMLGSVDGGAIYCSKHIDLIGSLHDIWNRIADISCDLIRHCVLTNPEPESQPKQIQETKQFSRVRGSMIDIDNAEMTLEDVYDQIRMLDAPGFYPQTRFSIGNFSFTLSRAQFDGSRIVCDVAITEEQCQTQKKSIA